MFSKKDLKGFQQKYQELSSQVEQMEVEASSGGGMVRVRVNGRMELVDIHIKPECVDPQDVELLQDLIKSAMREAQELVQKKMSQMMPMGGLGF